MEKTGGNTDKREDKTHNLKKAVHFDLNHQSLIQIFGENNTSKAYRLIRED